MDDSQQQEIASIFNCKIGTFSVTYLGIPLRPGRLLKVDWHAIIDKVEKKPSLWRGVSLSRVGTLILINAVLSALPSYIKSFYYFCQIGLLRELTNLKELFSGLALLLLIELSV